MAVETKQFTIGGVVSQITGMRPEATHAVLARGTDGMWFLWSSHTSFAAAEKSATKQRLATGSRQIVELEATP